ncbi:hypothetical protein [Ramlibacter albus]|uniref:Uncharacterized protein n=1 Tax=Ramlibacter albus TaxID=2079448 RepID=A0A923MB79_9BURK|nr:hypothetical protein [Ramlibacter albus]MBC5767622.1 hypothetical protein [Ramlibacter albus]
MNTTVISIGHKRSRGSETRNAIAEGEVIWPVSDLPDQKQTGQWLNETIAGKPYEGIALSLWTHHPNFRLATEKLAGFITPRWPAANGEPLLGVAVERAARAAEEAIDRAQSFEGRVVGVYLYGLASIVEDVAKLSIRGIDRDGASRGWEYFSVPLLQWARGHGIEQLLVRQIPGSPASVLLHGLRNSLIAHIASATDAGCLAKYAPHG